MILAKFGGMRVGINQVIIRFGRTEYGESR